MNNTQFENYMQIALQEAASAYEEGEVPVGCVIVERESGRILARTRNSMQADKNANHHAEMLAIEKVCKDLDNKNLSKCDIYVTLEPCTMCASAISNARLGRLYYGSDDSKMGGVENGVRFFASNSCFHKPEIYAGIGDKESAALIKNFFSNLRKDRL